MTALAAAANRRQRGEARLFRVPVNALSVIHKGAIVALDTTGFAVPGDDAVAFVVAGIARESVTGGASDGDEWVTLEAECEFLFVAASITAAMLGDLMTIVDDNTVDDAAGPTNDIPVGRLTEYVSNTSGWVYVPGLTTL